MFRAARSLTLRPFLVFWAAIVAAGILRADDFWKSKPRSEWTLKQTLKLLQDSPWARQEIRTLIPPEAGPDALLERFRTRCGPGGVDASGNCIQARPAPPSESSGSGPVVYSNVNDVIFLVRWESSATVMDAFAHLAELGERATAQYLSMPPRLPADRYVITLKALERPTTAGIAPGAMPADPIGSLDDEAGSRARLVAGNLSVAPAETERSGVGAAEAVHFYFPRQAEGAPLCAQDRPSRVTFEFRGQRFSLKTHFSLTPDMLQ